MSDNVKDFNLLKAAAIKGRDLQLVRPISENNTIQIFLGVTVKSITENEMEGVLSLAYTLTIKMVESFHDEMYININKEGDSVPNYRNMRSKMDTSRNSRTASLSSEIETISPMVSTPKHVEEHLNNLNAVNGIPMTIINPKEPKDGIKLITRSAHMNSSVKCVSDVDFCPFIVSTYDLSIKLNAIDDDYSVRKKLKTVFVSRYLHHFLEFQAGSIGKGVSKADFVGIVGVSKVKEAFRGGVPEIGHTKYDGLWVDINDAEYETDEIVIRFTTRRKQVSNLVRVVFPCILVPLIFGEMARRETLGPESLLTGVLTLIFAMPEEFGFGTAVWFAFALAICVVTYVINNSDFGLCAEVFSVILGTSLLIGMYVRQGQKIVHDNEGGHIIANLVKDKEEAWKKLSLWERLCLE